MSSGRRSAVDELLDLAVRRQDPGAVRLRAVGLAHHAELEREPEHLRHELERLGRADASRRLAGRDVELGVRRLRERDGVPDDLVHDVGLGRVERHRVVADVLRRPEVAVGQRAVEVEQADEAGGRVVGEAGQRGERRGDVGELRDVVGGQVAARRRRRARRGRPAARACARARARPRARPRAPRRCTPRPAPAAPGSSPAPATRWCCAARGSRGRRHRGGRGRARRRPRRRSG